MGIRHLAIDRPATILAALLLVASLVAGCSSAPTATPTTAPTEAAPPPVVTPEVPGVPVVGVVVAPQVGQSQVLERLRDLAARRDDVDWLFASATSTALVPDMVGGLVDQGAALVCVVGVGQTDAVTAMARRLPTSRFCVGPTDVPEDVVDNVLYVQVRVEETAYLAGALGGLVDPTGPVGVITGPATYRGPRQFRSFQQGLADVGGPPSATTTGPVDDAESATAAAAVQFDAGISVVFATTGDFDEDVVAVASEVLQEREQTSSDDGDDPGPPRPTAVIVGPDVIGDEPLPDAVLAVVRLLPERVVLPAVDRLLSRWEGGADSVGLTEGAVAIDLAATPVAQPHLEAFNQIRGEIAAGDRDPG